jgi:hypothetical protein
MRHVDRHAEVVHAVHYRDPQLAEAGVMPLQQAAADGVLLVVREAGDAHAESVEHVHVLQ